MGQLGITVNAVAPGFVDTEMTHDWSGGQREQIMRRSALRRLADVDDVAAAVEFLLERQGQEHHRHDAHGGCRQYRLKPRTRCASGRLEPQRAAAQGGVERGIQRHVGPARRIIQVERIVEPALGS